MARPPNIVFIMADDLGYGDLGCYGNETIRTPYIDQLAADGMIFTDYHANGPVCTPTRAALLTGRYQQRCGLEGVIYARGETRATGLEPGVNSLGCVLQQAGYATALLGKWHLGYHERFNPVHHGFDLFRGYVSGNVDYHSHVDNAGHPDWWHNLVQMEEEGYVTDLVSAHAVDFIRQHRETPFFLYVAHEAPHFPYQGRHDKADRVPGGTFSGYGSRADRVGAYREMIEAMDDGVGQIVDTLRVLELADDTLIIFCSDNGACEVGSNGPLRGGKGNLFEGGHRVPAIASWPDRIMPGSVTDATVLTMDWLPTFAGLASAGIAGLEPLDGIDVSPVLFANAPMPERTTCYRYGAQSAARRGPWKLIVEEEQMLLFHLTEDMGETANLADEHPEIVRELKADLESWTAQVLDGVTLRTC